MFNPQLIQKESKKQPETFLNNYIHGPICYNIDIYDVNFLKCKNVNISNIAF